MPFDLDAYLERIRYSDTREPTAATLAGLHRQHVRSIPFENLDVLLGQPIGIDPGSIQDKLVRRRRGGYCFEQNGLFRLALETLGFTVTPLIGRVRWMIPDDTPTAATHMVLRVEADGRSWLADVGFGSMSLARPLLFETDLEQTGVAFEPRRLITRGPHLVHQARIEHAWRDVYQFAPEPAAFVDFEMGNWFTSTFPQSRFKQNLIAARSEDDRRFALLNREFTVRHADGRVEKRALASPADLLDVLARHFDLHFPAGTRFRFDGDF